jgi:catalase-peroxidase
VLDIKDDKTDTKTHEMTGKCPFGGDRIGGSLGAPPTLSDWYPDRLKVELLHQNGPRANPLGDHFDYATAFNTIDFVALKQDIKEF